MNMDINAFPPHISLLRKLSQWWPKVSSHPLFFFRKAQKTKCMRRTGSFRKMFVVHVLTLVLSKRWSQFKQCVFKRVVTTSQKQELWLFWILLGILLRDYSPMMWILNPESKKKDFMTHMLRVLDIYPHLVYNKKYGKNLGKSSSPMEPRGSGQDTETVETAETAIFSPSKTPQVHRHRVSWMLPPQEGHGETSLR